MVNRVTFTSVSIRSHQETNQQIYHSLYVVASPEELFVQDWSHTAIMASSEATRALGEVVKILVPRSLVRSAALRGCTRLSENKIPVERYCVPCLRHVFCRSDTSHV
ncbi:hypothetical protein IG631_08451 [Alternaria alternata]|jgi:hypothetical protein|nr:hypothetical protein IG631_08451 [Alternaria alternata]